VTSINGQIGERVLPGFVDKRRSSLAGSVQTTSVLATPSDYTSRNAMEVYLLAHGYNQATLNIMNFNDVVWAYRQSADAAGI
jgi:hypothetical protein